MLQECKGTDERMWVCCDTITKERYWSGREEANLKRSIQTLYPGSARDRRLRRVQREHEPRDKQPQEQTQVGNLNAPRGPFPSTKPNNQKYNICTCQDVSFVTVLCCFSAATAPRRQRRGAAAAVATSSEESDNEWLDWIMMMMKAVYNVNYNWVGNILTIGLWTVVVLFYLVLLSTVCSDGVAVRVVVDF